NADTSTGRSAAARSRSGPRVGSNGAPRGRLRASTKRFELASTARSSCAAAACRPPSAGPPPSSVYPLTVPWSASAAIRSIPCGCGRPPRRTVDFEEFSHGEFVSAVAETLTAESVTRVLYPDDSTAMGQGLRFIQEYFLVACSLSDLMRRFGRVNTDLRTLPDKVAIQLNDTHPAIAVPELMRILLDEKGLGWDAAWDLTQRTLSYTNHTLLPEALENWPVAWFEMMLPRHLQIIYEINARLLDAVRLRFPGDEG